MKKLGLALLVIGFLILLAIVSVAFAMLMVNSEGHVDGIAFKQALNSMIVPVLLILSKALIWLLNTIS